MARRVLEVLVVLAVVFIGTVGIPIWLTETFMPRDDSDPPGGRSGMDIRTDALTGCQYLSRGLGGTTPRLDGQDRHVGCKR